MNSSFQPTIVIAGLPNVGKSSIFNALTKSRSALVADLSGVTRDPLAGEMQYQEKSYTLVDTGGFTHEKDDITRLVNNKIISMIQEASLVLLVAEKNSQPNNEVQNLVRKVRQADKPLLLLLNKSDRASDNDLTDWYKLHPEFIETSATHRRGLEEVRNRIEQLLPDSRPPQQEETEDESSRQNRLVIAGKPNTGKSTLVNRLLDENRVITKDMPGTTRDVLSFPCQYKNQSFTLLDTPGVRRWAKLDSALEKFSILKGMEALKQCDVSILLIDGYQGLVEHDLKLFKRFASVAPAIVIGVNKIDSLDNDRKKILHDQLSRHAPAFNNFAIVHISALNGKGCDILIKKALQAAQAAKQVYATSILMRTLEQALQAHQPSSSTRFRPRLKFIHQISNKRRMTFRISGNQTGKLPASYVTYLRHYFSKRFKLESICFDLEFQDSINPYKKNSRSANKKK